MMDRRAFLKRMGVTVAALAVVPTAAAQLLERPRSGGVASLPDSGYEPVPYEEWPAGMMDVVTSSSVHRLDTSAIERWNTPDVVVRGSVLTGVGCMGMRR